ncbi:MAG: hypothetical protein QG583_588 [Patescibacteria group bacterium]|nr:hypothetical protein [Patescibacteria group bacterium]
MVKQSLKKFNGDKVAELETQMWQAYYKHKFFKLFLLLIRMMHELFGLNYFYAVRIAFYATSSAMEFRLNRGKEDKKSILKKLEKFYKNIQKYSLKSFDYKKVAELEMNW